MRAIVGGASPPPPPFLPSKLQKKAASCWGEQTSMKPTHPRPAADCPFLNSPVCPCPCALCLLLAPWVQEMPCRQVSGTGVQAMQGPAIRGVAVLGSCSLVRPPPAQDSAVS